ncbi:MAG: hypothetical protein PHP28_07255 [Actinomycetota bacterium]|nr:hypothetical protein [Actinomycetota bacterium]MDD5666030.1 hypothetical protein [Actinomycetota bacterium]
MPGRYKAEVVARRRFGTLVELALETGSAIDAEPGQFIHVRCDKEGLILRRPYSLSGMAGSVVNIMVREVGAGSAWLCASEIGQELDIMGPLGRGFSIDGGSRHGLVAGGTGIAPMRFLADRLRRLGLEETLYWGVEGEAEYGGLALELAKECDLLFATMDGSAGEKGNVVDMLLDAGVEGLDGIYACGPRGMLTALAESLNDETLAAMQVCMEERMACGVGACRGCVVPASPPRRGYLTVCRDGPVFRGRELDWERIRG